MNDVTDKAALREAKKRTKAECLAAAARKKKARDEKKAARHAAMERRAAALAHQPHPQKSWDAERAEEGRRMKKLRKQIEKRTRKDLSRHAMFARPPALPAPVEQPDLSGVEFSSREEPPREGLIPGTWRLLDAARLGGGLLNPDPLPARWTARHVGNRLIEAMDVLRRTPDRVGPKSFGSIWPVYSHESGELAVQAGAGTLSIGRNVVLRGVAADEAARAAEALQWPLRFLRSCNAWALITLQQWASGPEQPNAPPEPTQVLEIIANALNEAKEPVR